jgi:hypothetical protein
MRFSTQPRLILEMALIRMAELPKLESLENLIQRLELLEKVKSESSSSKHVQDVSSIFEKPLHPESKGDVSSPEKEMDVSLSEKKEINLLSSEKDNMYVQKTTSESGDYKIEEVVSEQKAFDWTGVIQQVKKESIVFGSMLEHLKVRHQKESSILELALEEDNPFYSKLIEDKKNKAILHASISKVSGNNMKIKWAFQNNKNPDKKNKIKNEKKNRISSTEASVERSLDLVNREPIIQKAMDIFSAQIIETHHAADRKNDQSVDDGL